MGYHAQAQYRPVHGDEPEILSSPEDVDALVDRLLAEDFDHTIAALYLVERPLMPAGVPDHEFLLAVDPQLQVGALMFRDASGNWASLGAADGRTEVHYSLGKRHRVSPILRHTARRCSRCQQGVPGQRRSATGQCPMAGDGLDDSRTRRLMGQGWVGVALLEDRQPRSRRWVGSPANRDRASGCGHQRRPGLDVDALTRDGMPREAAQRIVAATGARPLHHNSGTGQTRESPSPRCAPRPGPRRCGTLGS